VGKYWWLTVFLPQALTRQEQWAATALLAVSWVVATIVVSVSIPTLETGLGIPTVLAFPGSLFGALAAGVFAARPLMTWLNPALIKKGDDANAARLAAEKSPAKG